MRFNGYRHIKPEEREPPFQSVYRLDPSNNELTLLLNEFVRPNGLAFSPDETIIHIVDSSISRRRNGDFYVKSDGTLSNGHVFAEIRSKTQSNPDGMKAVIEGHLYVAAAGVIGDFSQDVEHLCTIITPQTPANCAGGDED